MKKFVESSYFGTVIKKTIFFVTEVIGPNLRKNTYTSSLDM